MQEPLTILISQQRGNDPDKAMVEKQLADDLATTPNIRLAIVPHLYDVKAEGSTMTFLRSLPGDLVVLSWIYARSAYWVLRANEIEGRLGHTRSMPDEDVEESPTTDTDRTIWCLDLRDHAQAEVLTVELDTIIEATESSEASASGQEPLREMPEETGSRWYPVIDMDRCTNCLECLNFCLFGVYGMDENDNILIEQPDACRAGCPACSRICPEGAIMFPQHKDPAIAGDPELSLQGLQLDLSQIFGGASPADLAKVSELAQAERDRALTEAGHKPERSGEVKNELDSLVDELDDMDL